MPDLANVSRKPLLESDRGGIQFEIHCNHLGLWIDFQAGKILDALERNVIFQFLRLYVVAKPLEIGADCFKQVA